MSVHIRLQRKGCTHKPFYHMVAADSRSPRDGKFIEKIGYYDPNVEPSLIEIKEDRLLDWYQKGAQLSATCQKLAGIKKIHLSRKPEAKQ